MEQKQLNFDKPLLSVRRFPSKAAKVNDDKRKTDKTLPIVPQPPRYKSELKSGPVRNPGTVPFVWEQCPGRPKDEKTEPQTQTTEGPPTIPKLPPGRDLQPKGHDATNASAKPSTNGSQVGNLYHGSQALPALNDEIRKCENPKGETEEEENSNSEDGDGAYEDAQDTLSRTESFFINCSVSGLSGLDDADIKTPMDSQTRDFMMGRFLPAAKAMASETPQHDLRKPTKLLEQTRQVKKVINGEKRDGLRYGPNFVTDHHLGDEVSGDDYDEREILPAKVCGLLPRLGFKNSFCLLNPLPGMSVRSRSPMSPLIKIHATSSSSGSSGEPDSEKNRNDISEQRSVGEFQTINPQTIKSSDAIDSEGKRVSQSFQELLADQNRSRKLDSETPMLEKTINVDTVSTVESLNIKEKEYQMLTGTIKKSPLKESSIKDFEKLSIVDKGTKSYLSDKVNQHTRRVASKPFGQNQEFNKNSIISASLKVTQEESTQRAASEAEKLEIYSEFPAPPPLPKSPTDSWLGRTLPTMSTRKPSIHSYLGTDITPTHHASKPKPSDPKWETIVKTTKTQHQHMRFSEDRLTTISET